MSDPIVVLDTRVVTGRGGGPDKTILNSPRFLAEDGYRMLCAYMHPPDDPGFDSIRRRAEELDAPLIAVPDHGPLDLGVARRLLDICRSERVQIWHGHDYKSNLMGLLLRPFWRMRLVTTVHGWGKVGARTPFYYALDRASLKGYESVICVSSDLHASCRELGITESRCVLLENGIDTERFRPTVFNRDAKRSFGLPPEELVIGAAGRLSPEKGFDHLIRAAAHLLSQRHNFTLAIAGDGDEQAALERLIVDLGCQENIRLLGYVDDTIAFYNALDLFVLSSLREGLPNVVLEAMAMEVPVIATRIAGIPKLIDDGENGLLIEPSSEEELTRSIQRLLDDEPLRRRMAQAGRETVVNRFSFEKRMRRLAQLYDNLLGSRRTPHPTRETVNR